MIFVYNYKTEERSPKDFRNYQNLIKLFKDLRDSNVSPREVLKIQNNFKSDLGKIKKANPNLKSEDQFVIQNVDIFLFKRKKLLIPLEIILFCSLKLHTKQNMEKDPKHQLLNKCFKDCQ